MAEKKTAKKENSQVDLEEILGDIKTVVSGEKETLFKVSEYKTIKLKKENLVTEGEKRYSPQSIDLNDKKLESLIRKIARNELENFQSNIKSDSLKMEKRKTNVEIKSNSGLSSLTKADLLSLSKKNKLTLSSKHTKAEIINELKKNKELRMVSLSNFNIETPCIGTRFNLLLIKKNNQFLLIYLCSLTTDVPVNGPH